MEKEITSVSNELVKDTVRLQQKKYRDESCEFLLEGFKAIEEAVRAKIEIKRIFLTKEVSDKYSFIQDKFIYTNEAVLKKISTTTTPPNAVAVGIQKRFSSSNLSSAKTVLLLENIKDLGNLGTILRTAVAFSIDAVVLYGKEVADLYNPKCVRAGVGNLWKIPVVEIKDIEQLKTIFKDYEIVSTLPKAKDTIYLKDYKPKEKYLIAFGTEATGLSEELINISNKKVTIEMNKAVESLNLSISVGVFLYTIMNK